MIHVIHVVHVVHVVMVVQTLVECCKVCGGQDGCVVRLEGCTEVRPLRSIILTGDNLNTLTTPNTHRRPLCSHNIKISAQRQIIDIFLLLQELRASQHRPQSIN